eukprot:GGOE01044613.1.p1 GENE.GGOE01044613.1~~GGOE01044613.1.p1  ORF type:complete len:729 (-),score=233.77 GGOE01044613.1:232-2418(-)
MSFLSKAQQLAAQFTELKKDEEQLIWEATQEIDAKPAAKKGKSKKKKGLGSAAHLAEPTAELPETPMEGELPSASSHRPHHVPSSPSSTARHHRHHRESGADAKQHGDSAPKAVVACPGDRPLHLQPSPGKEDPDEVKQLCAVLQDREQELKDMRSLLDKRLTAERLLREQLHRAEAEVLQGKQEAKTSEHRHQESLRQLRHQVQELQEELVASQQAHQKRCRREEELAATVDRLRAELLLHQETAALAATSKDTAEREALMQRQLMALQAEALAAQQELKAQAQACNGLRTVERQLRAQVVELKAQLQESHEALVKADSRAEPPSQREGQLAEEVAALRGQLEAAQQRAASEADAQRLQQEALQTQRSAEEAMRVAQRREAQLLQQVASLTAELQAARHGLQRSARENEEQQQQQRDLQAEVERLTSSLAQLQQPPPPPSQPQVPLGQQLRRGSIASDTAEAQHRLAELQDQLALAQAQHAISEAQGRNLTKTVEELKTQAAKRAEEASRLRRDLQMKDEAVKSLNCVNVDLTLELEALKRQLQEAEQADPTFHSAGCSSVHEETNGGTDPLPPSGPSYAALVQRVKELELEMERSRADKRKALQPQRPTRQELQERAQARATERQQLIREARRIGPAAFEKSEGFLYSTDVERPKPPVTQEYLKWVALQFLTTNNADVRRRLLPALATVLGLTPTELQRIRQANRVWRLEAPRDPYSWIVSFMNTL